MSYHPAKFGGYRHSSSRDIMGFVCQVALHDHVNRVLFHFMVRSHLRYVTILPSSIFYQDHRLCDNGDIMVLASHVISQNHVIKRSCDFIGSSPSK